MWILSAARIPDNRRNKKTLIKKVDKLVSRILDSELKGLVGGARDVSGVRVIASCYSSVTPDNLRELGDRIKDKYQDIGRCICSGFRWKSEFCRGMRG